MGVPRSKVRLYLVPVEHKFVSRDAVDIWRFDALLVSYLLHNEHEREIFVMCGSGGDHHDSYNNMLCISVGYFTSLNLNSFAFVILYLELSLSSKPEQRLFVRCRLAVNHRVVLNRSPADSSERYPSSVLVGVG